MNKKLKSVALLSAVVLGCVPGGTFAYGSSSRADDIADITATSLKLMSADSVPTKPRSKARRFAVGGVQTTFAVVMGALIGRKISGDSNVASVLGSAFGGCIGLIFAHDYWTSRSAKGCLERFNKSYNNFLISPLLRAEASEFDFVERLVPSYYASSKYALADAKDSLVNLQVNLNKTIDLGCELLLWFFDVQTRENITRKIDMMKTYLNVVVARLRVVKQHPEYALQEQYKRAIERMKQDLAAEVESVRIHNELARLRQQQNYAYAQQLQQPQLYPTAPVYVPAQPQTYARRCALCSVNLVGNKGYKTDCACLAGNYTYHHDCLKAKLAQSNTCPKCHFANPTVLSDFGDGFTPAPQTANPQSHATPAAPVVSPVQSAACTCAVCLENIEPTKRYRTDCNCRSGRYYYHHECAVAALRSNGNRCPKCNTENTTVKSAF